MTYAEQARERGWVRETAPGDDTVWVDPAATKFPERVWLAESGPKWWDGGSRWMKADSEDDALRLALAAWPVGGGE